MHSVTLLTLLFCAAAFSRATFGGALCVSPDYTSAMRRLSAPEVRNRTVVILGSSTAEGVGASSLGFSWASRLAQNLARSGIRVVNRSRAGTNTADSLERFDRDVTPHQPGFVILATSIVNEGFESSPRASYERYLENSRALIARVRDLGAVPATITMYPYSRLTAEHLTLLGQLTRSLEEWGWPLFNFWSPVATEEGAWIPRLSADGLHPLDAGHAAMVDAITDSTFSALLAAAEPTLQPLSPHGSWLASETDPEPAAIRLTSSRSLSSWTLAALLRDPAAGDGSNLLSVSGEEPIRLLRRGGTLELWAGEEMLLVRAEPSFGWHHVALSYQSLTGRLLLAIDGAVWGERFATPGKQASYFEIAGQCQSCSIAQVVLYRTNMHSAELAGLAGQLIPRRSLEAWAPLNGEFQAGVNLNAAQTEARVEAVGLWSLDPSSHPPVCETPPSQPPCPPGPAMDRAACRTPLPGVQPQ